MGVCTVSIYNGSTMASTKNTGNIQGSHEERFLKAFEEYSDALFRHAFMRVSDRDRAIDIVHDTFTKVWSYIRSGHEVDLYRPFLYKVLNNLIVDEYRKKKEESLEAILECEGIDEGVFPELTESTIEQVLDTLDGKKAFELFDLLPDIYREVLVLKFVDGLGPKEISQLVEQSENVVSVRIFRGLNTLKDLVDKKEVNAEEKRLEEQKK